MRFDSILFGYNYNYFISVIIIHFIFYNFSLVIFVGFVGAFILSLFKVLLRVFSGTIFFTLFMRLYYQALRSRGCRGGV